MLATHTAPSRHMSPQQMPPLAGAQGTDPFTAIGRSAARVSVARGNEIYAEGDEAEYCYRVASGHAMAYKISVDGTRQIYEFLLPGDFFGLELEFSHYFSVEAVTDLVVMKYPRRAIERLIAETPTVARALQKMTAAGLHSAYQRMLLLTHKSADERIAWFLLHLADRAQKGGNAVHLTMSRTDIADYLGMVIETVSRTLSRLKAAGTIALQGVNDVRLVNRSRLEAIRGEI